MTPLRPLPEKTERVGLPGHQTVERLTYQPRAVGATLCRQRIEPCQRAARHPEAQPVHVIRPTSSVPSSRFRFGIPLYCVPWRSGRVLHFRVHPPPLALEARELDRVGALALA